MTSHVASRQRHRLIGLWLALLALCALNLQGFEHYQRMLAEDGVCTVVSGELGKGSPKSGTAHSVTDCALSCAQVQPALPGGTLPVFKVVASAHHVADVEQAPWPQPTGWRAHPPRAPPALG